MGCKGRLHGRSDRHRHHAGPGLRDSWRRDARCLLRRLSARNRRRALDDSRGRSRTGSEHQHVWPGRLGFHVHPRQALTRDRTSRMYATNREPTIRRRPFFDLVASGWLALAVAVPACGAGGQAASVDGGTVPKSAMTGLMTRGGTDAAPGIAPENAVIDTFSAEA